jgi:hypothetical protein
MVYTSGGKWMPCERTPSRVDGERVLIFNDGVTARRHRNYEVGLEPHWANCPNSDEFKEREQTAKRPKKNEGGRGRRAFGCGCLGGTW